MEKFGRTLREKRVFSGLSNCMRAYATLETFSRGPRFPTEALDQPNRDVQVQFSRDEFTDYTSTF